MPKSLRAAIQDVLGFIRHALTSIERREAVEAELHNLRAYSLNVLELVEPDPEIEAAMDELYTTAYSLVAAHHSAGTAVGPLPDLNSALHRFEKSSPSRKAKRLRSASGITHLSASVVERRRDGCVANRCSPCSRNRPKVCFEGGRVQSSASQPLVEVIVGQLDCIDTCLHLFGGTASLEGFG